MKHELKELKTNEAEAITGNELIAQFMKLGGEWAYDKNNLAYDKSWDWLMPVVEKIEAIDVDNLGLIIEYHACKLAYYGFGNTLSTGNSKLEATYKSVVAFIKWYNETQELKLI